MSQRFHGLTESTRARKIIFVHGSVSLASSLVYSNALFASQPFSPRADLLVVAESLHNESLKRQCSLMGMTAEEISKMKEEKGKRAVFFYESAKRSVLAAEILLRRLETELAELESIFNDGKKLSERFGAILITAMS